MRSVLSRSLCRCDGKGVGFITYVPAVDDLLTGQISYGMLQRMTRQAMDSSKPIRISPWLSPVVADYILELEMKYAYTHGKAILMAKWSVPDAVLSERTSKYENSSHIHNPFKGSSVLLCNHVPLNDSDIVTMFSCTALHQNRILCKSCSLYPYACKICHTEIEGGKQKLKDGSYSLVIRTWRPLGSVFGEPDEFWWAQSNRWKNDCRDAGDRKVYCARLRSLVCAMEEGKPVELVERKRTHTIKPENLSLSYIRAQGPLTNGV